MKIKIVYWKESEQDCLEDYRPFVEEQESLIAEDNEDYDWFMLLNNNETLEYDLPEAIRIFTLVGTFKALRFKFVLDDTPHINEDFIRLVHKDVVLDADLKTVDVPSELILNGYIKKWRRTMVIPTNQKQGI